MRGVRAKLLRDAALKLTVGKPARQQETVRLPPRTRWVDVPDDGDTFIEKLRNKFLRSIGIATRMKRERRTVQPTVIREKRGTTRWAYKRLKRLYYRIRLA